MTSAIWTIVGGVIGLIVLLMSIMFLFALVFVACGFLKYIYLKVKNGKLNELIDLDEDEGKDD